MPRVDRGRPQQSSTRLRQYSAVRGPMKSFRISLIVFGIAALSSAVLVGAAAHGHAPGVAGHLWAVGHATETVQQQPGELQFKGFRTRIWIFYLVSHQFFAAVLFFAYCTLHRFCVDCAYSLMSKKHEAYSQMYKNRMQSFR